MSKHSWEVGRQLMLNDPPLSSLIFAAIRKADDVNSAKIKAAWPDLWREYHIRYWSPGGLMPGEDGFQFTEWRG